MNPFKQVEKRFKRYADPKIVTDFSTLIIPGSTNHNGLLQGVTIDPSLGPDLPPRAKCWTCDDKHPGLKIITHGLDIDTQRKLMAECMETYSQGRTNRHSKRITWATLGYHYDWTARQYPPGDREQFPPPLASLAAQLAACAGYADYQAEAAIVNYYYSDTTMGGHCDDAENQFEAPIVSISLGAPCIFVIGTSADKACETPPSAFLLQSGDVVIMGGKSRECVHGVPRVGSIPDDIIACGPAREGCAVAPVLSGQDEQPIRVNVNVRQVN